MTDEGGAGKWRELPLPPVDLSCIDAANRRNCSHSNRKMAIELTPVDNPPARPSPHPICLLIPSADEDELQDLTDDIRAHGLINPIVLFEEMILDGRNRAAACKRAGVAPRYVQF